MQITGKVVDSATGAALPNATIYEDSNPVTVSDQNGNFTLQLPSDAVTISASYVGYDTETIPEEILSDTGLIQLTKTDMSLIPVSVVAKVKQNPLPYALAAGGIGLLLFSGKKKKRVSGISTNTLLLVGGGLAAVFLIMKSRQATAVPVYNPAYNPYTPPQTNQTAADITAGGNAAANILNAISNL